jgi:hypothetical protein
VKESFIPMSFDLKDMRAQKQWVFFHKATKNVHSINQAFKANVVVTWRLLWSILDMLYRLFNRCFNDKYVQE